MLSYVFDNMREPSFERLSYLECGCDPATIARFEKQGVAPGWTCLEIGVGGGSIAHWLSVGALEQRPAHQSEFRLYRESLPTCGQSAPRHRHLPQQK